MSVAWVQSYLGGRSQQVQAEAKVSNPIQLDGDGVPQGSILGGLFHLISSNDFGACHQEGESVIMLMMTQITPTILIRTD